MGTWENFFTGQTPNPLAMFEQALLLAAISFNQDALGSAVAESGGYHLSEWVYQPDSKLPSFALYEDESYRLLITIAGTQSFQQFTQHLGGVVPLLPIPGSQATIASHGEAAVLFVRQLDDMTIGSFDRIDYSGHSYGASVAQITWKTTGLPDWMNVPGDCMTFGTCRSFFGPVPPIQRGSCVRVSNIGDDMVAHLPPKHYSAVPGVGFIASKIIGLLVSWNHIGYTVHLADDGTVQFVGKDVDDEGLLDGARAVVKGLEAHYITTYCRRLSRHFGGALHGRFGGLAESLGGPPGRR
jgi:hypothetical protein